MNRKLAFFMTRITERRQGLLDIDGTGYADWNESPDSSHAHTPLGNFVENDGCWVDINRSISICVRDIGK